MRVPGRGSQVSGSGSPLSTLARQGLAAQGFPAPVRACGPGPLPSRDDLHSQVIGQAQTLKEPAQGVPCRRWEFANLSVLPALEEQGTDNMKIRAKVFLHGQ